MVHEYYIFFPMRNCTFILSFKFLAEYNSTKQSIDNDLVEASEEAEINNKKSVCLFYL